jgi:multicomponent Na+:H+ antiporter subunit B
MGSLILRTAARFLLPLLLLFSLFLLLRGHDEPGGGFIAGLVAGGGFAFHTFAFDALHTSRLLKVDARTLLGVGLATAVLSGVPAIFIGQPFFASQWFDLTLPLFGGLTVSTPLIFDIGVYLVVVGVITTIVLTLADPDH